MCNVFVDLNVCVCTCYTAYSLLCMKGCLYTCASLCMHACVYDSAHKPLLIVYVSACVCISVLNVCAYEFVATSVFACMTLCDVCNFA